MHSEEIRLFAQEFRKLGESYVTIAKNLNISMATK